MCIFITTIRRMEGGNSLNCDCFVGRAGTRSSNSTGQPSRGKSFAAPFYAFRAALHPSVNTVGGKKSHDFGRILTLLPLDLKFPICLWSAAACCRFAVARLVASCIQQSKWETQHGKPRCPQRQQAAALHSAGKPAHKFCNRRIPREQRQDAPYYRISLPFFPSFFSCKVFLGNPHFFRHTQGYVLP